MKFYSIWSEGYAATGQSNGAIHMGSGYANSFKELCLNIFKDNRYYDPKDNTYWGCRLFDNEEQARKSFG
jgi:hypothetical protein